MQIRRPLPKVGELQYRRTRRDVPPGERWQGGGLLPALCPAGGTEAAAGELAALEAGQQPMGAAMGRLRE